jgi:hypothetical protein
MESSNSSKNKDELKREYRIQKPEVRMKSKKENFGNSIYLTRHRRLPGHLPQ